MSRPYFNINSFSYTNGVLQLDLTALKTRGGGQITISGLSSSLTYTVKGKSLTGRETATFSVPVLGTSSTTTYSNPAGITYSFGGTPSTTTNAKLTIGSTQLSSVTASNSTLATFLTAIANSITGNTYAVSATSTSTALFVTVPNTGNRYNNTALKLNLTQGAGGATIVATSSQGFTNSATFSGGTNTHNLVVNFGKLGYTDRSNSWAGVTSL